MNGTPSTTTRQAPGTAGSHGYGRGARMRYRPVAGPAGPGQPIDPWGDDVVCLAGPELDPEPGEVPNFRAW